MPLHRLILLPLILLAACRGTRDAVDPVLVIHTDGGTELGVSTTYGVVFLGATSSSGHIELEAWYGDGPSLEPSVIEPMGGGLYTAEPEIRLPAAPLRFKVPAEGDELLVSGRTEEGSWSTWTVVRKDERVHGLLLDVPPELSSSTGQVGAGIFWVNPDNEADQRLVGLVAGKVELDGREYLAAVGAEHLWRLVTYRRDHLQWKRRVYREDIL